MQNCVANNCLHFFVLLAACSLLPCTLAIFDDYFVCVCVCVCVFGEFSAPTAGRGAQCSNYRSMLSTMVAIVVVWPLL